MLLNSGTPKSSTVTMTQLVLPYHTNALDTVFGGTIMSWVDIAAAISAGRHCRKDVVTASIDALHFLAPVYVGWVVEINARVNFVSKRSLEVGVRVDGVEPKSTNRVHTASAYLTFVALDDNKKPTGVPELKLEDGEDRRRFEAASLRRVHRLKQKELLLKSNSLHCRK